MVYCIYVQKIDCHQNIEDFLRLLLNLFRIAGKMQNVFKVEFQGQPPIIRKGKMEEITLNVFQRGSNKKVSSITGKERVLKGIKVSS